METITTKEAARRLGMSQAAIARMWRNGTIRGHKLRPGVRNSHLRVNGADVDAIVASRGGTVGVSLTAAGVDYIRGHTGN